MLERCDLHEYQHRAIDFIKDRRFCGLALAMGLGKSVSTLTTVSDLLEEGEIKRALIVAPLRVANTVWKQEARKWKHLAHLDIGIATGSAANRRKVIAKKHRITIINRENIPWLVTTEKWGWDALVVDESSSFKSHKAKRFKALKAVRKALKYVVLLTGTPSPNGLTDMWAQQWLIDQGEALGKTITAFRRAYCEQTGYMGYSWAVRPGSVEEVQEALAPDWLSMAAEDYLEVPETIPLSVRVELAPKVREQYDEFEKEFLIEIESTDIAAPTAGVLANKLLQLSNGFLYDEEKTAFNVHKEKIDALGDIVADNAGENILVAYNYKEDLEMLRKAFPKAKVLGKDGKEVEQWNRGKIRMLLAHPASAGHGLNLQQGGSFIVWYGMNWSLELYQQFNARLHRQGQTHPVRIAHIVAQDTIDERVMQALQSKAKTQRDLLEYLRQ